MGFVDRYRDVFSAGRKDASKKKERAEKPMSLRKARAIRKAGYLYEKARPVGRAAKTAGKGAYVIGKTAYDIGEELTRPPVKKKGKKPGTKEGTKRKFGDKTYKLVELYPTKTMAKKDAESRRKDGMRARVTQEGDKWGVWIR